MTVPSWWQGQPMLIAVAILFGIVLVRAQATYWIGRAVRSGTETRSWGRWLRGERVTSAVRRLHRYGPPVIPLSFLTVGFQTAVNAAAGVTAMAWPRYTLWMLPGALAWAVIYATVGFAVIQAAISLHGWIWVVLGVLLLALVILWWLRRRRAGAGDGTDSDLPERRADGYPVP